MRFKFKDEMTFPVNVTAAQSTLDVLDQVSPKRSQAIRILSACYRQLIQEGYDVPELIERAEESFNLLEEERLTGDATAYGQR